MDLTYLGYEWKIFSAVSTREKKNELDKPRNTLRKYYKTGSLCREPNHCKKIADALGSIPIMTLNPHVLHDRLLINDAYQNNNGLVDC